MGKSKKESETLKEAIRIVEDNGLNVFRRRKKEKLFVKLYLEPLATILPKISGSALKVFHALGSQMNYEDTIVEMSQPEIQEATNLSEATVREALNELEELKVISRIGPNIKRKYVLSQMFVKKGK